MIVTARRLAVASLTKPRQSDLRRSISTAYYALFHAVARDAADLLAGGGAMRADRAWSHVYRGLEHGFAKNACKEVSKLGFPVGIMICASEFIELQEMRHDADYDPRARFTRAEALQWTAPVPRLRWRACAPRPDANGKRSLCSCC